VTRRRCPGLEVKTSEPTYLWKDRAGTGLAQCILQRVAFTTNQIQRVKSAVADLPLTFISWLNLTLTHLRLLSSRLQECKEGAIERWNLQINNDLVRFLGDLGETVERVFRQSASLELEFPGEGKSRSILSFSALDFHCVKRLQQMGSFTDQAVEPPSEKFYA